MSFWLVANRSFTSEAGEQFLPLGVMLAASGLPHTIWEKSQTTFEKKPNREKQQMVKQCDI